MATEIVFDLVQPQTISTLPSGHVNSLLLKMTLDIVSIPMNSRVIFNSYVKSPEGNVCCDVPSFFSGKMNTTLERKCLRRADTASQQLPVGHGVAARVMDGQ